MCQQKKEVVKLQWVSKHYMDTNKKGVTSQSRNPLK